MPDARETLAWLRFVAERAIISDEQGMAGGGSETSEMNDDHVGHGVVNRSLRVTVTDEYRRGRVDNDLHGEVVSQLRREWNSRNVHVILYRVIALPIASSDP